MRDRQKRDYLVKGKKFSGNGSHLALPEALPKIVTR
jgi:hypothetical protein